MEMLLYIANVFCSNFTILSLNKRLQNLVTDSPEEWISYLLKN